MFVIMKLSYYTITPHLKKGHVICLEIIFSLIYEFCVFNLIKKETHN